MPREKATDLPLPDLPVLQSAGALRAALSKGHAVLTAEPGSGKTTLVPLLLLDERWLAGRKILMLEPRRPAARMAARRMATLLDESVGETVGYQVRFERKCSAVTRIEVLTEGLLLRRLQRDPEIADVGLVIFDEFHERSLQSDLSLALCMDVADGLRDDLRLLVMSASLDARPLVELLPAVPVNAEGRTFPVATHQADEDGDRRNLVPACLNALRKAVTTTHEDVLVFLPGRREIDRLCEQAARQLDAGFAVLPLHGELPAAQQDAAIQGESSGERRRVIVATDIAETSLTIEGVGAVVDSGLARKPSFDPGTGLTRLTTRWISKASAMQRAGRAGRLGPGRCFRTWTQARHNRLDDWTTPEISRADLTSLVLELANWGVADPKKLRWLDPPPDAAWQRAFVLLRQLEALDEAGCITALGREMARFPTHPRLAHLLASAKGAAARALASDVAALLSERDPLRGNAAVMAGADIGARLELLSAYRDKRRLPPDVDNTALRRIDQVAKQYLRLCSKADSENDSPDVGAGVAAVYPERVAMMSSGDGRRYLMRNGRAALLHEDDPLRGSPWLAVAEVDAGQREGRIHLASALRQDQVEALFASRLETSREVRWDSAREDVLVRVVRRLDAIVLSETPDSLDDDDPVNEILFEQIRLRGLGAVFEDKRALRIRVEMLRALDPDAGWPDFSEQRLLDHLEDWLLPWLKSGQGMRQLSMLDFDAVLGATLGWDAIQRLDDLLPLQFETPAGTRRAINYAPNATPVLAVPLQEMLGLSSTPTLAEGQVPLLIHLLSPAGRVLQMTKDLTAFWAGAYDEVKKEMRGRYPKHYWPDDPADAQATRFTKRRMTKG